MSVRSSVRLTVAAAAALAISVPAAGASARPTTPQPTAASSSESFAAPYTCGVRADYFTLDGTHTGYEVSASGAVRTLPLARWSFVPRSLSYSKTVLTSTTATDYYYAITPSGWLYRVGETTGLASGGLSVSYVAVSPGWATTKDIAVRQDRFHYVTATGELRRRLIQVGGSLTGSVLIRSGLTTTVQLSSDATVQWGSPSTSPVTDELMAVTSTGALQRHEIRVQGGAVVPLSRLTTLKTSGWNRFNTLDVARCSDDSMSILARDYTSKAMLAYREGNAYDYSGSDITYGGHVGSLLHPTYGA